MLGFKVKDTISGFTGVVVSKHRRLGNYDQFGVQPMVDKKKPGEHPDPISFDGGQLKKIGLRPVVKPVEPPKELSATIGDLVEDAVTGVRGVLMDITTFLNGCVYFSVQMKGKDGETPPKHTFGEHFRFKKVGEVISTVTAVEKKPRGGPTRIAERM